MTAVNRKGPSMLLNTSARKMQRLKSGVGVGSGSELGIGVGRVEPSTC